MEDESWTGRKAKVSKEQNTYLAFLTEKIDRLETSGGENGKQVSTKYAELSYGDWRFENPDEAETKKVRGARIKWCTNDCHIKSMWCERRICSNKVDYAAAKGKKKKPKEKSNQGE